MIEYFIEVPNTTIKEPVEGFAYDKLYDMAQEYGIAQLVWYALNGKELLRESTRTKIKPSTKGVDF